MFEVKRITIRQKDNKNSAIKRQEKDFRVLLWIGLARVHVAVKMSEVIT